MLLRSLLVMLLAAEAGCTSLVPPDRSMHAPAVAPANVFAGYGVIVPRPIDDEIRLLDSRMIRSLVRSDEPANAVFLNGPQRKAVIIGASVVGVYLISEWIEDEVALLP